MVWDKASMALKKQFDDLRQATKDAAELKKQQEKEDKAQKKEQQEILRAQRKALAADHKLQKTIQKDLDHTNQTTNKKALKQLHSDSKMAQHQGSNLGKQSHATKRFQTVEVVVVEDNNGRSSVSASGRTTRVRNPLKYLKGYETLWIGSHINKDSIYSIYIDQIAIAAVINNGSVWC
jgi:CRISPR/Cas system CMR subunit Cmr4 (Cas7 group RAMP superfamily)